MRNRTNPPMGSWATHGMLILLAGGMPSAPAVAAGVVGNGSPASCTEAALDAALAGGGTVAFNCGGAVTIPISAQKLIGASTILETQNGTDQVTLECVNNNPLFKVSAGGVTFDIRDLTLTQCASASGGAVIQNQQASSTVHVTRCRFLENVAEVGGAISSTGILTVTASLFSQNYAMTTVIAGGAIYSSGDLAVQRSTFVANGTLSNGARGVDIAINGGTATIWNSTFAGAQSVTGAAQGYAIAAENGAAVTLIHDTISAAPLAADSTLYAAGNANILFRNSLVQSTSGAGQSCRFASGGAVTDQSGNLQFGGSQSTSCGGTIPDEDPQLQPLGNNGGTTATMALAVGSPAIDAAVAGNCLPWDQRVVTRPQGAACDSGAYEYQAHTPPLMGNVPDQTATQGVPFSLDLGPYVTPTDGDQVMGFAIGGSLPPGLGFSSSMIISGTPTVPGTYNLLLAPTDDDGTGGFDSVLFTVLPAAAPLAVPLVPPWALALLSLSLGLAGLAAGRSKGTGLIDRG